jgi:hypothetical protein
MQQLHRQMVMLLLLCVSALQAKAALLEHIQLHGMLAVPHEHLRAALDLPPSSKLDRPERTLALKKVRASTSRWGCPDH